MSFRNWIQGLRNVLAPGQGRRQHRRQVAPQAAGYKPKLELLEDRRLLAFLAPVDYAVGANPPGLLAADFNNDNVQDLAFANSSDSTVSLLLGRGDGTFEQALDSATGSSPHSLAVGDFDADGNPDLATANAYDVTVLMGNGAGAFETPSSIVFRDIFGQPKYPASVAVGDFNGDGLLDLGATSNYYYSFALDPGAWAGTAHVLLGNGDGSFAAPNDTWTGTGIVNSGIAADLNGDRFDDLVTDNTEYYLDGYNGSYVHMLLGDSSGYLQGPWALISPGDYTSFAVAVGDLDADGDTDLVSADFSGKSVGVLLGNGDSSFNSSGNYATVDSPGRVVLGDFTGDGKIDIATANDSDSLSVLYGGGDGTFSYPVNFAVGFSARGLAAADFNGDGWLDAAILNSSGVSVLINDRSWQPLPPPPPPPPPPTLRIGDVAVTEGNTDTASATFTVTLSAASTETITVAYASANGSATTGSDFQAASGTLTFAPGEMSKTVIVAVNGDRLGEANETFVVNLSNPTNATIADGQATGTIIDDEPRISIGDVTKSEGRKGRTTLFTFTVTLSAASDQPVTMSYRTADGTATTAGNDYVAKTGTLTFAAGETTKTITIEVKGDRNKEGSETFYLDLFGLSSNASFTKNRGIGTIQNDD
jgi:hypothetical protein